MLFIGNIDDEEPTVLGTALSVSDAAIIVPSDSNLSAFLIGQLEQLKSVVSDSNSRLNDLNYIYIYIYMYEYTYILIQIYIRLTVFEHYTVSERYCYRAPYDHNASAAVAC